MFNPAIVGGLILLVNMGPGEYLVELVFTTSAQRPGCYRWPLCRREEEELLTDDPAREVRG